ncbi:MAG TPA: CerR family C-terminal domain-containing protein [Planctomycetota bacterium]|nr:CerR family C-terminal domain-containing protein [Planctomycetota bacterium]
MPTKPRSGARAAPPPASHEDADTRARLLEVAAETFGEKGFRRTTIREICHRAKVNVAAIHYHFGSKENLYEEALLAAFAHVKRMQAPRPDPPLDGRGLPRFLRFFVKNAVERILQSRKGWHVNLIRKELVEPTFALDRVVKEYFRPNFSYLRDCLAMVLPGASRREVELHALSIIGQIVYYCCAEPIALRLLGEREFDQALCDQITEHVTSFSARAIRGRREKEA